MATTSSLSKLQTLLPELFQSTKLSGKRYLRFELTSKFSALIAMDYVQESLLVSAENITAIPNMAKSVMGLMNSRDRVFCVIDLAQLLEVSSLNSYSQNYHLIVIRIQPTFLSEADLKKELLIGIAVNKIQGITRLPDEQIQVPLDDSHPILFPYLQGTFVNQEEELLILNMETIIDKILAIKS